jgi:predicted nucleic acid-binding protein
MIVVDASVVVKAFIPEQRSDLAIRLFESDEPFWAPAHMLAEAFECIVRARRKGNLDDEGFVVAKLALPGSTVSVPLDGLLELATSMSLETNASVYDCLYVALAEQRESVLITDDDRLIKCFDKSDWSKRIVPLAHIADAGF